MCFDREQAEIKFNENQSLIPYVYHKWFHKYSKWQEDLFQEGYLALWRACCKFQDDGTIKFVTYATNCVYYQMVNYCSRFICKQNSVVSLESLSISETPEGNNLFLIDILSNTQSSDTKYLIEICLNEMRPEDRKIIQALFQGYNQKEIAELLSISQATVSRKLRLFKRLIDKEKNNND